MKEKEKEKKVKLIITPKLSHTVNYLHRVVGSLEWSGILIYSVEEGDISNPNNLVLKAQDMYVMDVGTSGRTEYDFGTVVTEIHRKFPQTNPFLMTEQQIENGEVPWRIGHIHTHHNMDTFFSPTDTKELEDNAPNHSYYLSLIANFKTEYKAKIAICGDIEETQKYSWKDGSGKEVSLTRNNKKSKVFSFDCEVVHEGLELTKDLFEAIKERNKKKRSKKFNSKNMGRPIDISPMQKSLINDDEFLSSGAIKNFIVYVASLTKKDEETSLDEIFRYIDSEDEAKGGIINMWEDQVVDNIDQMFLDYFPNTLLTLSSISEEAVDILRHYAANFMSAEILTEMFAEMIPEDIEDGYTI